MFDPQRRTNQRVPEGLATLPFAAYTCDIDGRITCFNERAEELWGRRPALNDAAERYCGSVSLLTVDGARIPHETCWTALALQSGSRARGARPWFCDRMAAAATCSLMFPRSTTIPARWWAPRLSWSISLTRFSVCCSDARAKPTIALQTSLRRKLPKQPCKPARPTSGAFSKASPLAQCRWEKTAASCGSMTATAR